MTQMFKTGELLKASGNFNIFPLFEEQPLIHHGTKILKNKYLLFLKEITVNTFWRPRYEGAIEIRYSTEDYTGKVIHQTGSLSYVEYTSKKAGKIGYLVLFENVTGVYWPYYGIGSSEMPWRRRELPLLKHKPF